jgi:hypothetical protein
MVIHGIHPAVIDASAGFTQRHESVEGLGDFPSDGLDDSLLARGSHRRAAVEAPILLHCIMSLLAQSGHPDMLAAQSSNVRKPFPLDLDQGV